jgi:serine/threonine protein kinase
MGVVYKARHRLLGNQCALKISTPGSAPERYIREARVMAQIDSPYVVTVRECGMMRDNRVAMVMDWIDGEDLGKTLLREGIIEEARARRWMLEAARGLATASNQGIVHRDVKPSNIMIDDSVPHCPAVFLVHPCTWRLNRRKTRAR